MNADKYQVVIGLEVHVQLLTRSKLLCGDSTEYGKEPNTQVSPVSLAHPGTIPRLNKKAMEYAVTLGCALECNINQHNYFARKNYFYPDLPKGYQVSQHTAPICSGGFVTVTLDGRKRKIRLNRIHMEEDAGKSIHDTDPENTCVDLNRAGVPLLEIVSEPDLYSAEEAYAYLTELRRMVRWLNICDGNMEQGSMRCDANVSVKLKDDEKLGTRVEIKNLNSIRNVKRAIEFESTRLVSILESGNTVAQETRSYDADNNVTFSLRSKEEANDYRYFPEPDLPPVFISEEFLQELKDSLPVLPDIMQNKLINEYGLTDYDATLICSDRRDSEYFEMLVSHTKNHKAAANWIIGPVRSYCLDRNLELSEFPLPEQSLATLIDITEEGKISFSNATGKILQELIEDPSRQPLELAASLNLVQEKNADRIEAWINMVIESMPAKVAEYKSGKKGLIGLFAGEVKKISKGKADMELVSKMLHEKLSR